MASSSRSYYYYSYNLFLIPAAVFLSFLIVLYLYKDSCENQACPNSAFSAAYLFLYIYTVLGLIHPEHIFNTAVKDNMGTGTEYRAVAYFVNWCVRNVVEIYS